jgi:serine/threonine protein kinase
VSAPPIDDLITEQDRDWTEGRPVMAEVYLERHPGLAEDRAAVEKLIGNEVLLRRGRGEEPREQEYRRRFPDHAEWVEVVFRVLQVPALTEPHPRPEVPAFSGSPIPVPGQRFGDFDVHEEIGSGGMSKVFRAVDRYLGRQVALKVILPEKFAGLSPAGKAQWEARLRREGECGVLLDQTPAAGNFITVYRGGVHGRTHFLAMKYIRGRPLSHVLGGGPLGPAEAVRSFAALARALDDAHRAGIIHRDLKPANILQDVDGRLYVADFGLAKIVDRSNLTSDGAAEGADGVPTDLPSRGVLGTRPYMPPEQLRNPSDVTAASDVYSLGATLWEALTGRVPDRQGNWPGREQARAGPGRPGGVIPTELTAICRRCLAEKPEDRYGSAEELAEALAKLSFDNPTSVPGEAASRLRPALLSLLAGLAGAGGVLLAVQDAVFSWFQSPNRPLSDWWAVPLATALFGLLGGALGLVWSRPPSRDRVFNPADLLDMLAAGVGGLVGARAGSAFGQLGSETGALMGACLGASVRPIPSLAYFLAFGAAAVVLLRLAFQRVGWDETWVGPAFGLCCALGAFASLLCAENPPPASSGWRWGWLLLRVLMLAAVAGWSYWHSRPAGA